MGLVSYRSDAHDADKANPFLWHLLLVLVLVLLLLPPTVTFYNPLRGW